MRDLWNFNFFGRGEVSPTHSELCRFISGSKAKHQVSSCVIILLKKILSASAIAIMSWQDVTLSSLCSGDNKRGTKRAHNFLFPKSSFRIRRTAVLGMFKDSAIILDAIRRSFFDQISNSSNVYLSSSRFCTATSLVIYQLASVSKSRIPPKNVWSVQPHSHKLCTNTSVSVADRQALKQNFMATLCSFPPSKTYKENWLYKPSYKSYTVEDKQTKLGVWTDVDWWYLMGWPIDRSNSVI